MVGFGNAASGSCRLAQPPTTAEYKPTKPAAGERSKRCSGSERRNNLRENNT
jgi:hypothetical protein